MEVAYDSFDMASRKKTRDGCDDKEVNAFINMFKDNMLDWKQREEQEKKKQ